MLIQDIDLETLLHEFVTEQHQLLANDSSEQSISHQLARKLAEAFSDYHVDCEYNRDIEKIKRLIYAISPNGSASERNVVPDIIIHRRMTNDNLIAIEVKKSTNQEQSFKDRSKLRAFREQLGYQHTLFVRFLTGSENTGISECEFI
ncbi:hypothetical protein [Balneatrix alpica]|uniref:Type I restriction enzyme R protein N-terminal domain-containing protein n=1 Tax=Balneatrix alpica TaxID=75684 RepID=A0ABV5ZF33_9GAMM|nr:hypothetical protein [Balneatrix alpica]